MAAEPGTGPVPPALPGHHLQPGKPAHMGALSWASTDQAQAIFGFSALWVAGGKRVLRSVKGESCFGDGWRKHQDSVQARLYSD